jgi:poly(A) polymerase
LMPIITPAYPSMNAAFNITHSSKTIINRELDRACQVSEQIMSGKRPWADLFEKHTFFAKDHKYYLGVVSCSLTKEAHKVWSGYVESKVRTFVQNLDKHNTVVVAQVFMKKFDRVHFCSTDDEMQQVQQGSLKYKIEDADEKDAGEGDAESTTPPTKVYTSTHYIGLELRQGKCPSWTVRNLLASA